MSTFWLSYADDAGFRGAVIIDGADFLGACAESRRRGLSPGGQVAGVALDFGIAELIPAEHRNRRLDRREVDLLEAKMDTLTARFAD